MFAYSQKDLNTIDPILEPLFARAKEHAAQTEQLAMDATRLMSVRPDQFEISAKQPFFKRLLANFNGQTVANVNNLYEMQRIGWRYIQILNERDLMMAHSMITVKNNLLTLAVTEKETRELMTTMANKIADRFEILEEKYRDMAVTQEIHGWLLTFGTRNYHKQPEKLRLLQIVREAFLKKQTAWNFAELPYLHQALINAGLDWEKEITLADFIDGLIDEIDAHGFDVYEKLITLESADGRIEQKFILENISAPSHKSLYKIADNYDASSEMIDLLADQLSISKKDAMKKVLRGFIEKEGIDTTIKIPMRDLAVELLGCHGLTCGLKNHSFYEVAENYYLGENGVEPNYQEAVRWYKKAALHGNVKAEYSLGFCYANGLGATENKQEAVQWYKKAADKGDEEAMYQIGFSYEYGEGVEINHQEAVKWYTKAAEQGFALAQYFLGCCYEDGEGVTKNLQEAVKWYAKSAEQGDADGQRQLGFCYEYGEGVTENPQEAVKWYTKSAEQGNALAQYFLGCCYDNGLGVAENTQEAVNWYTKAAEQGNALAQYSLGFCYNEGKGVTKNSQEAAKWYTKSAEQGNSNAQNNLGVCFRSGVGVTENHYEAVKCYTKAAEQGNQLAQGNLGACYEKGIGVTKDKTKAEFWLAKAKEPRE